MEQEIFAIVKGTLGIVTNQQILIEALHKSHHDLNAALRRACGLPEDDTTQQPVIDAEVLARTQAGIAELEKMFRQGDEKKEES